MVLLVLFLLIDELLHVTLRFDHDMKTSLIASGTELLDLFQAYFIYDFARNKVWPLDASEVEVLNVTMRQIDFTLPLYLNQEVSGSLHFDIRQDYSTSDLFFGNVSETRFLNLEAKRQFTNLLQVDEQGYLRLFWSSVGLGT